MKNIRVAIGVSKGKINIKQHAGDNPFFLIYDIYEDGTYKLIKEVENTAPDEKKHADEKKMKGVMGILGDIDVIIGGIMSPNFLNLRDKTKIQPVVSKIENLDESLICVAKNFDEVYELVSQRREGKYPKEIPTFR